MLDTKSQTLNNKLVLVEKQTLILYLLKIGKTHC